MEPYKHEEHFALTLLVHTGTYLLSLWQSKHAALKSKASTEAPRPAGTGGGSKTAHGAPNPTKSERNDLATNCPR